MRAGQQGWGPDEGRGTSKVTSKLQVTIPSELADQYGIRPGDHARLEAAGEVIRVMPADTGSRMKALDMNTRPELFDAATARQQAREANQPVYRARTRGWAREALYARGRRNAA